MHCPPICQMSYVGQSKTISLEEMAKKTEMTLEEIRAAMETALADRHYATLILLYITKTIKESIENEEF